jgi:hypothetical protein
MEEAANIIEEESKLIKKKGKEPFYLIPMNQGYERFNDRIKNARPYVSGLTSIYADFQTYFQNFKVLANYVQDNDFLRILSNVERTEPPYESKALYPLSFLISDLYSVKYGGGFGKGRNPDKEEYTSKRLDLGSLEYLTIQSHKDKLKDSLDCVCPICDGREIDDVRIDFYGNLPEAFRIHETFALNDYNKELLDTYEVGKTFEFFKDNKSAKSTLDETYLSRKIINQSSLLDVK